MATNERILSIVFSIVFLLLSVFIVVYITVATIYALLFPYNASVIDSIFLIFDGSATIIISVLAIAFVLFNAYLSQRNHNEQIEMSYRVKQLEELYLPLKTALEYTHKIDVVRLEKYSYLAVGELAPFIKPFIEMQELTYGNVKGDPFDAIVLEAVNHDIHKIKEKLKSHVKI